MIDQPFHRVSKRRPCPVCEKPDWCLYAGDETDPSTVICARVESEKRCGEAGWLHRLRDDDDEWRFRRRSVTTKPKAAMGQRQTDVAKLADVMAVTTPLELLERLADSLGLTVGSLRRLRVGWSTRYRAWCFPMHDAAGQVTGIRLRYPDGRKLSVRGGRESLFVPADLKPAGRLFIAEGPTDTAALTDMGFPAVGRPSCMGGVKHVVELVERLNVNEVVIVADDDAPGQRGANSLASVLRVYVPMVKVVSPPAGNKDVRAWKAAGATAGDIELVIASTPAKRLAVTTSRKGVGHAR